jgi:hypothetical protein
MPATLRQRLCCRNLRGVLSTTTRSRAPLRGYPALREGAARLPAATPSRSPLRHRERDLTERHYSLPDLPAHGGHAPDRTPKHRRERSPGLSRDEHTDRPQVTMRDVNFNNVRQGVPSLPPLSTVTNSGGSYR